MMQVFRDERERDQAKARMARGVNEETALSGICPPTRDIVKRRYERTRQTQSFLPFRVRQVVDEISSGAHIPGEQPSQQKLTAKQSKQIAAANAAAATSQEKTEFSIQTVIEEVVDFQDWMVDDAHPQ